MYVKYFTRLSHVTGPGLSILNVYFHYSVANYMVYIALNGEDIISFVSIIVKSERLNMS